MLYAKSLPGNPYDGHTLRDVVEDTQKLTGCEIERAYVDKGYRRPTRRSRTQPRLYLWAEARRLRRHQTPTATSIRNRARVSHMKAEGHRPLLLKGRDGDAANTILTAVGYDFRQILAG